jgi:hypothetical protein
MENNSFHQSERDNESEGTDNKSHSNPAFASYRPAERISSPPPAPERRPVLPMEGIISWRDRQDELNRKDTTEAKTDKEDKEGENEDADSDEDSKSTAKPKVRPQVYPQRFVLGDVQPVMSEQGFTEMTEEDTEDETVTPGASPAVHMSDALPLDDFPPLAPRENLTPIPSVGVGESVSSDPSHVSVEHDDDQPSVVSASPSPAAHTGPYNIWNQTPNTAPQPTESDPDEDENQIGTTFTRMSVATPPPPPTLHQAAAFNQQPMGSGQGMTYNQYIHPATQYGGQPNVNAAPSAPVMPIERPTFNSNYDPRVGQMGAVLGLGLLAEHIGRKRGDRKVQKNARSYTDAKVEKQGEAFAADQRRIHEQQRQFANEQQQQMAEMQRLRQNQDRFAATQPVAEQYTASQPNVGPFYGPSRTEGRPQYVNERPAMHSEVQQTVNPEQPSAQAVDQVYNLQPKQHVEHSTWHNIVVDEHGHEVTGAINYGEGFKRELQQEMIRDRVADGVSAGSSGQGGQHQGYSSGGSYPGALPSGMTTPSLPQGQPTHADLQHQLEASNKRQATNLTNPWFWVMLLLVIAVFFTATLI